MSRAFRAAAKIFRALSYCSLALLLSGVAILLTAGIWLAPPDVPPKHADVLIVLSGGLERSMYAGDLFRDGFAPKILVSRPAKEQVVRELEVLGIKLPREEELHKLILTRKSVPPQAIGFFGEGALSTAEEAQSLAQIMTGPTRLLVVTSPTHVLRARLILSHTLKGNGIEVQVVSTPYETFEKRWWGNQGSARSVVLEIAKLVYYFVGGRFFSGNT